MHFMLSEYLSAYCFEKIALSKLIHINLGKGSSKLLSFERDNTNICIPFGSNFVRTFLLANRNADISVVPLK